MSLLLKHRWKVPMKYPYFVMRNFAVIESVLQKYRLIFCVLATLTRISGKRGTKMIIKMRYETEFKEFEMDVDVASKWVNISIKKDETQEDFEKRIQEEVDKQYNKPEYNIWHRETRHIDPTPKRKRMDGKKGYICGEKDDDSFDIMNYLAVTYSEYELDEEEEERVKRYEDVMEVIHKKLKSDFVEIFVVIASKKSTPKQIASKLIDAEGLTDDEYEKLVTNEANKISKKYNRALQKIKKVFTKTSF